MTMKTFISARWLGGAAVGFAVAAFAVSPAQVQQRLDAGEKITFVDVRLSGLFQKGHLPGAINIPSQLVPEKQLPPLGQVVVYDGGLGEEEVSAAAAALNQKHGITAEVLEGGYAAWEMAQTATTQPGGMRPEATPLITYAELKQAQSADVVLVDLRQSAPAADAPVAKVAAKIAAPPLTDLSAEFPQARVVQSPFASASPRMKTMAASSTPPLLVLIDKGDGSAQTMARTLKANGITRFVILAGGEQILSVHGEPGLQRVGSSLSMRSSAGSSPAPGP